MIQHRNPNESVQDLYVITLDGKPPARNTTNWFEQDTYIEYAIAAAHLAAAERGIPLDTMQVWHQQVITSTTDWTRDNTHVPDDLIQQVIDELHEINTKFGTTPLSITRYDLHNNPEPNN